MLLYELKIRIYFYNTLYSFWIYLDIFWSDLKIVHYDIGTPVSVWLVNLFPFLNSLFYLVLLYSNLYLKFFHNNNKSRTICQISIQKYYDCYMSCDFHKDKFKWTLKLSENSRNNSFTSDWRKKNISGTRILYRIA